MWPGSFSVEVDCTKTQILNNIQWACITQITRRRYLDHDQCPCTHTCTCTFNVLVDTKSLQKKYTDCCQKITVFPKLHVVPLTSDFTVVMFCSGSCHRYYVDMVCKIQAMRLLNLSLLSFILQTIGNSYTKYYLQTVLKWI